MKDIVLPSNVEVKAQQVAAVREKLSAADGNCIALSPEPLGRPVFLVATAYSYPFPEFVEGEPSRFGLGVKDSILLVSLHDTPDPVSDPVGFIDWEIKDNSAVVESWHTAQHQIYLRTSESLDQHHKGEGEVSVWLAGEAFYVRQEDRRRKVGSLLIATSLVALQWLDVVDFRTNKGSVTPSAISTWSQFGVTEEMHIQKIPLSNTAYRPRVNETLAYFA